jgi:hypothetical protein
MAIHIRGPGERVTGASEAGLAISTVLLSLALHALRERRERENPLDGCSSFRHWHRSMSRRLPRFRRACPSTALDERVL